MKVLSPEITTSQKPAESGLKTNTSLTERIQTAIDLNHDTSVLLQQKQTKTGARSYALTVKGKDLAQSVYSGLTENSAEVLGEAHAIRAQINLDIREIKKSKRAALTAEWKSAGRKKPGNMDEFNSVLKQRLADNITVAQYQLERKILSSITQRSRIEAQRESLALARAAVTEEEILAFSQRLTQDGKRVPNRALLINAIARARIKEKSLEVHEAPVVPTSPVGPLTVEAVPAPENVAPAEAVKVPNVPVGAETPHVLSEAARQERSAAERARLTVSRINLRAEVISQNVQDRVRETQQALAWRWKMAQLDTASLMEHVKSRKPALAAAGLGMFAVAGTGAVPISHTDIARAFSSTQDAIVQIADAPNYGINIGGIAEIAPAQEKIITFGTVTKANPTFYNPGTNEQVPVTIADNKIEVLRPAGNNRFLVKTPDGEMEMSMDQLDVQGPLSWEKDVKRLDWLGFDNSDAPLMDKLTEIGAGSVIPFRNWFSDLNSDRYQM